MAKCNTCRKADALDTRWDRLRSWLMWKLFAKDINDEKSASFTQGFSDGYIARDRHDAQRNSRYQYFNDRAPEVLKEFEQKKIEWL